MCSSDLGKAEILLNPDFNTSEAFSGTLLFNSQISESASSAEHKVPLGDDVSITVSTSVPERRTELDVTKTAEAPDKINQTITYTVKVSSPTGTSDPVTVYDYPYETGLEITEITDISDNRITENTEQKGLMGTFPALTKNGSFSFSYTVHYAPTKGGDEIGRAHV